MSGASHDTDPQALTRRLLAFNTVNPPGRERACAQWIGGLLEDAGFQLTYYEFAEARTSLVARIDGTTDKLPICFTGHLDVVPVGGVTWKRDPFAGEADGDKLYGRGATDMKAGVAAMAVMAQRMAKRGKLRGGLVLVLTAGEETCCQGAALLARTTGALGPVGAMIVGEPTCNEPWIGHKGVLWLDLETTGTAAHASMPDCGDSAIYKAADAISALRRFDFASERHDVLGTPTLNVGTMAGGSGINTVPDHAAIAVDIRTIPGQSIDTLIRRLQSALGDDVVMRVRHRTEGIYTATDNAWVQEVYDVMEPLLGARPTASGGPYFTDASVLAPAMQGPPVVILGPGDPELAHKTDEHCSIARIEQATEAYTEIARRWCVL